MKSRMAQKRLITYIVLAFSLNACLTSCKGEDDGMLSDDQKIEQAHKAHDSYMQGMQGGKSPSGPGSKVPNGGAPSTGQPGASK